MSVGTNGEGQVLSSGVASVMLAGFTVVSALAGTAALVLSLYVGLWPWALPALVFILVAVGGNLWMRRYMSVVVLYSDRMEIAQKNGRVFEVRPSELESVSVSFTSPEIVFLRLTCSGCPESVGFVAPMRSMPFGIHPLEEQLRVWKCRATQSQKSGWDDRG